MPGPFAALSLQQSSDIHRDGLCGRWPDTDFWGGEHGAAAPARPARPGLPQQQSCVCRALGVGATTAAPRWRHSPGSGDAPWPVPAASARLSRQLSRRGQQRRSPGCAPPAAPPHRDLLLCPCGDTDNKVYSNRSGGGTVTCSEPPMRHGPAFCLSS